MKNFKKSIEAGCYGIVCYKTYSYRHTMTTSLNPKLPQFLGYKAQYFIELIDSALSLLEKRKNHVMKSV